MKSDLIKKIEEIISNQTADESELILQLMSLLQEADSKSGITEETKSISSLGAENLTKLKSSSPGVNLIKTGLSRFDNLLGGFTLGELVVIGGRPAMGKTVLLCNLALNISIHTPLLYITLDLPESTLTKRMISTITNIEISKLMHPDLSDTEKEVLGDAESTLSKYKIYINDSRHDSLAELRSYCQKQIEENGVKVIMLDYLQMMNSKEASIRHLKVGSFIHELKKISRDFNVCVIAASQLSRFVEFRGGDKRPQLSDLKDSGSIEEHTDKVIFMYRPEYYQIAVDEDGISTEGTTELIVAKNRNGRLGTIKLKRNVNFTKFKTFDGYSQEFNFQIRRPHDN